MASPKFSNRSAELYKTTSSFVCHWQSWLYQRNYRIYQGWTCCCALLSPQTPNRTLVAAETEPQHQSDLWDRGEGAQGCTQGCTQPKTWVVIFLPGSSGIWENIFGAAFWRRTSCDAFSPATHTWQAPVWQWEVLLGMPQCLLEGLAVGSGWKALLVTCPTCLWLDLTWPPGLI